MVEYDIDIELNKQKQYLIHKKEKNLCLVQSQTKKSLNKDWNSSFLPKDELYNIDLIKHKHKVAMWLVSLGTHNF